MGVKKKWQLHRAAREAEDSGEKHHPTYRKKKKPTAEGVKEMGTCHDNRLWEVVGFESFRGMKISAKLNKIGGIYVCTWENPFKFKALMMTETNKDI